MRTEREAKRVSELEILGKDGDEGHRSSKKVYPERKVILRPSAPLGKFRQEACSAWPREASALAAPESHHTKEPP
jgi:hypothetical protein